MPRPVRNSRGFTGIEILIVLAVVGVLAGVGFAGTIQYRAYAAEAEMRQDLVHFVNQQQILRQRTGALGTMEQLDGIGFRRSPGVVVEENRLHGGGRRAYLRVRHVKTGQRCSVDYSPFVSNALNRVQCWAGPNDRDGAETVAGSDGNPAPGRTTVAVDTPVVPPIPVQCAGVPALGIASPPDQTDANPGAAGTGTFTLSNPGAAARSYDLRFSSSNPAVVPSVSGPSSVAVPAGASRSVAATFQVADNAESGQVAVLPLEATDIDCPSLRADGFFAVSARLTLMDPAMTTPPDLTLIPGQTADIVWSTTNRVNATRMLRLAATYPSTLTRESATGLGSIPFARGETQGTQLRLHLADDVDGFTPHRVCLTATDQEASSYDAERCMTITAAFQPRPATVTGGDARTELPNAVFRQTWTVTNNSNAPRDFQLAVGQTGDLALRSTSPGPTVRIGRDQSITVTATYQLSETSLHRAASTTTLTVLDPGTPAESTSTHTSNVTTGLALAHPTVTSAAEVAADPGQSGRLVYSLRNNTNEDRTFSFTHVSSHDGAAAATATPARVTVPAFGSVPVEGPFSVAGPAEGGWAASFTLTGTDVLATLYSGSGGGKVTVNTVLAPPTILGPPSCPSGDPGASGTLAYSLRNNSNVARTFGFTFTSSADQAATPAGTPASVTVPAFGTVAVNAPWAIPATAQGGWTATLTLAGRDAEATSLAGSGRCVVTVNTVLLPPAVSAGPGVSGSYGQWATIPFAITNRSNVARSFVLAPSAGNPPIVAAFGQIGTIPLPAFGSTSVNLPLQFSAVPSANLASAITLTASDAASGSLSSSASSAATRINSAPAVSPSFTPNNVPRGTTITGYSNATDPDGVIAAVHWWTNSPSGARVYRGSAPNITFVPNEVGDWTLSAQAIDNNNEPSPTVTTSAITVVNRAPTAILRVTYPRAEEFIYNDEVAQLDLHQSSDPDGDPLTGNLSSGMTGTFGDGNLPAMPRTYTVTGTVFDGQGGTASTTVEIVVRTRVYGCMDPGALNYKPDANTPAPCFYVKPPVANLRVYQDGDNRGSYWTRKWTYADPSASYAGDGATGITQYQWTWGMPWGKWDELQGRFVRTSEEKPAYTTTSGDIQRVAYDGVGDFPICVKVWNNAGLSHEDCETVAMKRETRARLGWLYRSAWIDHANWAPGDWFGNGHGDHGQQRHTFDANASTGDVPIQHAWMELRMRVWRDTRSNLRDVYFSHTTASEDVRPTQDQIVQRCGTGDIMRYEDGIWCYERAWRMEVTPRPDGTMGMMYQPFHLGRDGWYGENVDQGTAYSEFTLHVIDINGRETTDTKRRWHQDWRETIGWVNPTQSGPTAWFQNEVTSDDGGVMTLSDLRGQSAEGRVLRMWYVVEYDPGNGDQNQYSSYPVYGSDSYELHRPKCGRASVTVMAEDDQRRQGWGTTYELPNPDHPICLPEGGGVEVPQ